jgi:30S ribosomal protein S31
LLILRKKGKTIYKYQIVMGKGDKKSRRGKIIIGTFGVRRRKKKPAASQAKPDIKVKDVKIKDKKVLKEKKEVKEVKEKKEIKEPKEVKAIKEVKAEPKAKASTKKKSVE